MGQIWTQFFLQPMLNGLLLLYGALGQNFAAAIAVFTIIIRLITLPLSLPQQRSAKKMQELQPQLQALQKKYKDDKEKLAQAQMELYREAGVNPLGGCLPLLIQFPIWIGLYQSIAQTLAVGPLQLLNLSTNIYKSLPWLSSLVPVKNTFLWLDLGKPDPLYILPVLVVASTWFQQKVMSPPASDPQSASMNQSMQVMFPLMLGFFSLQFPSGLALYFVVSNIVGIVIQYFTPGWVGVSFGKKGALPAKPAAGTSKGLTSSSTAPAANEAEQAQGQTAKKGQQYGKKRRKRRG
ncbi:MAG: YidC/Oxa1 family membrane protein insertase [Anaerolineae bacterium]